MPSFDIVSEVNQVEVSNALDQTNKEVSTRFDFKGSDARVEHAEKTLTIYADDDFKLKQVTDILTGKLTKRGVDVRALKYGDVEKISGNKVKQVVTDPRRASSRSSSKRIVKLIKDSKIEGAGVDPGDAVRVSGAKARRPAGRDRARQEVDHRFPRSVRQLPRLRPSPRTCDAGRSRQSGRSAASARRVSAPTAAIAAW